MSTIYNGVPSNIANTGGTFGIASSTNATPIRLTTVVNHGLIEGDIVEVTGHATNTNANGLWRARVTGLAMLELVTVAGVNSVGNGVGGATGQVLSRAFLPAATLTSDGDPRGAASVNVGIQAALDRASYVAYRALISQSMRIYNVATATDATMAAWSAATVAGNAVYSEDLHVTAMINAAVIDPDVVNGDGIEVDFSTTFDTTVGVTGANHSSTIFALFWETYDYGSSAPAMNLAKQIPGTAVRVPDATSGPLVLRASLGALALSLTRGQKLRIYLGAQASPSAANKTYSLLGDRLFAYRVWR